MITKEKFDLAALKADLVNSDYYKKIRDLQLKKILELSKTEIEPLEIKGMLKMIAHTDEWGKEFENIQKERKEQEV